MSLSEDSRWCWRWHIVRKISTNSFPSTNTNSLWISARREHNEEKRNLSRVRRKEKNFPHSNSNATFKAKGNRRRISHEFNVNEIFKQSNLFSYRCVRVSHSASQRNFLPAFRPRNYFFEYLKRCWKMIDDFSVDVFSLTNSKKLWREIPNEKFSTCNWGFRLSAKNRVTQKMFRRRLGVREGR